jgi:ABC-2 type transport system ATP-binding protein
MVPAGTRLLVAADPAASGSMLLRILGGLARRSAGRVEIAGLADPSADGWGRRVAYLGSEPGIHGWMTPRETLELASRLLDLDDTTARRRTEEVLGRAGIPPASADRPVRRGGQALAQRTGYAAALLADPEVLLLDEPLRSLDAAERHRLLDLPGERRTVVLHSRYPASEAGHVTHVALLRGGRIAMLARADEVEALGHGLAMRGIAELADRRAAAAATAPPRAVAAAR